MCNPCGNSPARMDTSILYTKNGGPSCTTEMANLKNIYLGCVWAKSPLKEHGPGNQLQKYKEIQILYLCFQMLINLQ